jgi:hypothetical protein
MNRQHPALQSRYTDQAAYTRALFECVEQELQIAHNRIMITSTMALRKFGYVPDHEQRAHDRGFNALNGHRATLHTMVNQLGRLDAQATHARRHGCLPSSFVPGRQPVMTFFQARDELQRISSENSGWDRFMYSNGKTYLSSFTSLLEEQLAEMQTRSNRLLA